MLSIFFNGAFGFWSTLASKQKKTPKQKKDNGFMVLGDEAKEWKVMGYDL